MAKITYGAKGNASKVKSKKKKEKEEEEVLKRKAAKPKKVKSKDIVNEINEIEFIDDTEIIRIPEHLRNELTEEEKLLYNNNYITQAVTELELEKQRLDEEDYSKLKKRDSEGSEEVFTDWDVRIDDPILYFDPTLSYELTGYRPIDETHGLDFNPDWFRQDAITKEKTGKYSTFDFRGPAYNKFWDERVRRCSEGYTSHGYTITGWNYFYLNFYRMQSPAVKKAGEKGISKRSKSFPSFIAKQYEYFHYLELARRTGNDALVLKGRGLGFSEMGANNGVCMYSCEAETQSLYTAFTKDFLEKTLEKCWVQLDYLNTETEGGFKHLRQGVNTMIQKKSSVKDKEGNESGFLSMITGIVADKPYKVRGDRTELLIYEEFGSNPQSKKQWIQGDALVNVMGQKVGFKIGYGTGRTLPAI